MKWFIFGIFKANPFEIRCESW